MKFGGWREKRGVGSSIPLLLFFLAPPLSSLRLLAGRSPAHPFSSSGGGWAPVSRKGDFRGEASSLPLVFPSSPLPRREDKARARLQVSRATMQFMLLFSRQGKLRLQKWYVPLSDKEKKKITRELVQTVLARKPKMCSFLEWRDLKIVYKRYASLYFCCAIEDQDNELITLEIIHRYVELLDKYFGSVCELDIIFNFEKAYFILDEFLLGGEVQETSKKNVLKAIEQADLLQEEAETPRSVLEEIGLT
ncbi:AP-1 complex subunit sigma-2 isoform X2 [Sceloporus undulatus]|uniref:AP-1 complex subunit sigma-2 isoform X2 n=1 Tax=Sceloporus undulatus TaxID=8520 RepID=UPI001C4DA35D|nr:AP-1 complex subunit sigma-2 isoform X2 [Sceloporus undulatus]